MFSFMSNCETVALIPDALYVHRARPCSITHTKSEAYLLDSLTAGEEFTANASTHYPELTESARAYRERIRISSWLKWLDSQENPRSDATRIMIDALEKASLRNWKSLCLPADSFYFASLIGLAVAPSAMTTAYRIWQQRAR